VADRIAPVRAAVGDRHPIVETPGVYLPVTVAAVGFLATGFAPTTILGIERTYMIAGVVLLPYAFLAVDVALAGAAAATGRLRSAGPVRADGGRVTPGTVELAVPVVLAALLLINAGVLAATVTEERSTQPLLDRQRTVAEGTGTPPEVFHLYAHYTPRTDVAGAGWLHRNGREGLIVYGSEATDPYPSYFFFTGTSIQRPPGPYRVLERRQETAAAGYVFVDEYSARTGAMNYLEGDQRFGNTKFVPLGETVVAEAARVYVAGETAVYYDRGAPANATVTGATAAGNATVAGADAGTGTVESPAGSDRPRPDVGRGSVSAGADVGVPG
jgi:hypothetical protein